MKLFALVLISLFTLSCSNESTEAPSVKSFQPENIQETWKADTARYLFQTLENYNYDYAAQNYVADPEAVLRMKEGQGQIVADALIVKSVNDLGVVMTLSTFCYPDVDFQVFMEQKGQRYYVQFANTMKDLFRASAAARKPVRKYCYEFKDQPVQGDIMGQPWMVDRVEQVSESANALSRREVDLVDVKCQEYPYCVAFGARDGSGSGPVVGISSLDLTGDGGNLGGDKYIHIAQVGTSGVNLYKGSYRVTHLGGQKIRIELALPLQESIELNGYVEFELID
ncbi:MAG: hypothetical protein ABNH16_14745 [Thalassolituus sp.]|jgi:hypothetical protein|tara:strand:- start:1299 stop:2144 length:846 start_codon:yes stop_codon:yes gene_type:complete